jgi:hypothetical protein
MDFISHVLFIAKNKNTTILQKKREKKKRGAQHFSISLVIKKMVTLGDSCTHDKKICPYTSNQKNYQIRRHTTYNFLLLVV